MEKENEPTLKDIRDQIAMFMEVAASKDDLKKLVSKEDLGIELVKLKTELKTEIGKARDAALDHTDVKADEVVAKIGKIMHEDKERDKGFKQTLVSVMRSNDLASKQELEGLAQAI